VGHALKRFTIEEYSIAELLDDPIAGLLMKSDGVNRQALKRLLLATRSRFQKPGPDSSS
jgi:hypothetical protein